MWVQPIEPDLDNASEGSLFIMTGDRFFPHFTTWVSTLEKMPLARQQKLMYWVGGLAPLATNLVTPIVTYYRFQNTPLSKEDKRFNVVQEVVRQGVSAFLHGVSFFGGAWLFQTISQKMSNRPSRTLVGFLGGVLGSFLSYALIRPLISCEILLRWLYAPQPKIKNSILGTSHQYLLPEPSHQAQFDAFLARAFRSQR